MQWLKLLPVVTVMMLACSIQADELARPGQTEPKGTSPVQVQKAYEDFPADAYPPGFSSYQGLGFMGSCCEQTCPEAESLWQGYCCPKGHHAKLLDGTGRAGPHGNCLANYSSVKGGKVSCVQVKGCAVTCPPTKGCAVSSPPAKGCAASCTPACGEVSACSGPGANYWPMNPCAPPLGARLHAWKGSLHGTVRGSESGSGFAGKANSASPVPPPPLGPSVPAPVPESDVAPASPSIPPPPAAAPAPGSSRRLRSQPPLSSADASLKIPAPSPRDKTA